jgi:hypothetical protein
MQSMRGLSGCLLREISIHACSLLPSVPHEMGAPEKPESPAYSLNTPQGQHRVAVLAVPKPAVPGLACGHVLGH